MIVNVKVAYIRPKYKNLKHWIKDKNNVYIGRGRVLIIDGKRYPEKDSIWANKYKVGKDGTRKEVIKKYRNDLTRSANVYQLLELENKVLGCWCKDKNKKVRCHGDEIVKLIDIVNRRINKLIGIFDNIPISREDKIRILIMSKNMTSKLWINNKI